MRKSKMLTAREFSKATGISYPVVMRWLRDGTIQADRVVNIWQISEELAKRFKKERPKRGRPRKNAIEGK